MPLELQEPTFDRPFEEIYRELRARIPRYNPEWTNFNDSDPGITLLQLFALAGRDDAAPDGRGPAQELPEVRRSCWACS